MRPEEKQQPRSPFLWGAATSSHQVEGGNRHNDWWHWEEQGKIEGGARSGAASDHRTRFREDMRLAAELGLNSYRFSIEWSRIQPEEDRWDLSELEWYRELVAECERNGLVPMATLHHFTSPQWFAEKGGFSHDLSPRWFAAYVQRALEALGPRVPLWCTFNEPMVLVAGTYLGSFMPPAKFAPQLASKACRNLLQCHVDAYDRIHAMGSGRRDGPWRDLPLQVGIAHNMLDFRPDRRWHPIEKAVSSVFWRFYNRSWLDAVTGRKQHFGIPFLVPYAQPVESALGRATCDYIGVNYYTKGYVQWRPRTKVPGVSSKLPLGLTFARRKEPASDLEWAVHPKGFARVLDCAASYGLPIYVTENGIADNRDHYRPYYLVSHLREVARAIERGRDIRGYYHWSLLDNFEWIKGFGPRFGLYRVNYDTFERTATGSALLLKKLIEAHGGDRAPSIDVLDRPAWQPWAQDPPLPPA
jgi:beta-glucosidase